MWSMHSVSYLIADRLALWGVTDCFMVTGGAAMHLNDALAHSPKLRTSYLHHEQACAIAAEGFARIAERPALVNVTAGPGAINSLNGVFGAYTDSIPMIVLAGQAKRETLRATRNVPPDLRQLGDQEADTMRMVGPITKASWLLTDPNDAVRVIDAAFLAATSGRPGPVWVEVPVDVQGAKMNLDSVACPLPKQQRQPAAVSVAALDDIVALLDEARRPVILMGTGVRLSSTHAAVIAFAEAHSIPIVTAWTHDVIASDHPLFAGRPGTIGTRAGNFVVQNCDLILILGSRLNIRQISYNFGSFARHAVKIWVDIDAAEMEKPFVAANLKIMADLRDFVPDFVAHSARIRFSRRFEGWASWCRAIRARYEPRDSDYAVRSSGINSYHLIGALSDLLRSDDIVVCGDATATIVPFQRLFLRANNRLLSNSGSASMGHDLPCAIGAALAAPDRRVVCLAGDGSVMLNIQELASIRGLRLDVRVIILDNDGYLSIKQTQRNFFGREAGASSGSGLHFPDFLAVASAFGLDSVRLSKDGDWRADLAAFMGSAGPGVCVAPLDLEQEFEPRLKSRMIDDVISTPELDDMFPFLPAAELESIRQSALAIDQVSLSEEAQRRIQLSTSGAMG